MQIIRSVMWTHGECKAAFEFYLTTMHPVDRDAATRHGMDYDEFADAAQQPTIEKYMAVDDSGTIMGVSMQTDILTAWPTLSPAFFARRYPDHYEQGRIWYVIFVAVSPPGRLHNTFGRLVERMTENRHDCKFVVDFCEANIRRGIIQMLNRTVKGIDDRATMDRLDAQEFYAVDFEGNT